MSVIYCDVRTIQMWTRLAPEHKLIRSYKQLNTHFHLLIYKHATPSTTTEASNLIKMKAVNTLIRKTVTHRCLHFQKVLIPSNVL